jgi:hypothetical protein
MTAQPDETSRSVDNRINLVTFIESPLRLDEIKNGVPQQGGYSRVRPMTDININFGCRLKYRIFGQLHLFCSSALLTQPQAFQL